MKETDRGPCPEKKPVPMEMRSPVWDRTLCWSGAVRRALSPAEAFLEKKGCPLPKVTGRFGGCGPGPDFLQAAAWIDYIAQCRQALEALQTQVPQEEAERIKKAVEEAERIAVREVVRFFQEEI